MSAWGERYADVYRRAVREARAAEAGMDASKRADLDRELAREADRLVRAGAKRPVAILALRDARLAIGERVGTFSVDVGEIYAAAVRRAK